MKLRHLVTVLFFAAMAMLSTGCANVPQNGPTTQPIVNGNVAWLTSQVNYFQGQINAGEVALETMPPGPKRDAMIKKLGEWRWYLNWFSLALAAASVPA